MRVRVAGVPEHFNWPWHLALENQRFVASGHDIEWRDYPAGTGAMVAALNARAVDMALLLTEGALAAALTGGDFKLVQTYVRSALTWGIHVSAHGPITNMASCVQPRIAISRHGSGSHLIAIVDAMQRGQDLQSLEFVVVGGLEGARKALAAGEADIFLWERYTTSPLVERGEFRRIDDCVVPWPAFTVAVRDDWLPHYAADIVAILRVVQGEAGKLRDRRHAVSELANAYGLNSAQTAEWFADVRWSQSLRRPVASLTTCFDALKRAGILSGGDPLRTWFSLAGYGESA